MEWLPRLQQYSNHIAGDRWDAEDLAQDAAVKVIVALQKDISRPITNAYLYRVILNTWRDKIKSRREIVETMATTMELLDENSSLSTRELLEVLAESLQPRMVVILLLMDVFDFTAKETASMIGMKEPTVQVALGRARKQLRRMAVEASAEKLEKRIIKSNAGEDHLDLDELIDGFRNRSPEQIYKAYVDLSSVGLRLTQLSKLGGRLYFTFRDPDGNLLSVISK